MYCPNCTTTPLVLAERQGIEIDYCPHCRGVWLDRGELDKLLERAAQGISQRGGPFPANRDEFRGDRNWSGRARPHKSWLSEIFD
jgi:Zn-finger nucleic acid-binding protein